MGSVPVDGVKLAISAAGAQKEEDEGCVRVLRDNRRIHKQLVGFDLVGKGWGKPNHREQHNFIAFRWRGWRCSQNEMTFGLFQTQIFVHFQASA